MRSITVMQVHLLFLGGELRSIGQVLHGAAAAARVVVGAGCLHCVGVLHHRRHLDGVGVCLFYGCDARAQVLARKRAVAENREPLRQLAHALPGTKSIPRTSSCFIARASAAADPFVKGI